MTLYTLAVSNRLPIKWQRDQQSQTGTQPPFPYSHRVSLTPLSSSVQCHTASFNTSQALRRVGDDSTIDFAFLPHLHERPPPRQEWIKVPFLPDNFEPLRTEAHEESGAETVIRAEILTVAHDSTHVHAPSAMSEVVDNNSILIDPFKLTEQVSGAAARSKTAVAGKKPSELKALWDGLLDDIFGPAKKS
ncbi:MAG: hypothetical protein M1839_008765 [Geoglossum umbratile]|nr:MAG: hypothetical protein M1839_008765 [Geoglossum umbratile]